MPHTKRAQVLMEPEEYRRLEAVAAIDWQEAEDDVVRARGDGLP